MESGLMNKVLSKYLQLFLMPHCGALPKVRQRGPLVGATANSVGGSAGFLGSMVKVAQTEKMGRMHLKIRNLSHHIS